MGFFASIFSCCGVQRSVDEKRQLQAEAEARRARIANLYAASNEECYTSPPPPVIVPPPSYADIAHDHAVSVSDNKNLHSLDPQEQPQSLPQPYFQLQYPAPAHSRPSSASSRSSVISVPSTRLSDLTSMHTGTTNRTRRRARNEANQNDDDRHNSSSWRDSGYHGSDESAPPSYYAGSERSTTPSMDHPVMRDGWLEGLRFDTMQTNSMPTWETDEKRG